MLFLDELPEAKTVLVTILIAALVVSGLVLLNVIPTSSAFCSVWNYAGHGSAPILGRCNSSTGTTTTTSSYSSSSSAGPSSQATSTSSSSQQQSTTYSSSASSTQGIPKASLSLSTNSFDLSSGGQSADLPFELQTTVPINLTVIGANNFVVYDYCLQSQCVQNDAVLEVANAGTYHGLITAVSLADTPVSTYTSTFEAVYNNEPIVAVPISAIVGGGTSNYFCTEQSFSINITRSLIEPNGHVYSSTPLQSLISAPKTPTTPVVAYDTTIQGIPSSGGSGSFLVTYEVLGTGPISTNAQAQVLTQGPGWKLFEFQQNIPATGGSFNVYMNATDMLWGEYYAGLDANTQSLLSSAGLNGNQIWILYYEAQLSGADIVYGQVNIQGCSGISSVLQYFSDILLIPMSTAPTTTSMSTATTTHGYSYGGCGYRIACQSLVPSNGLGAFAPVGKSAPLIGLADALIIAGVVGAVIFVAKEHYS